MNDGIWYGIPLHTVASASTSASAAEQIKCKNDKLLCFIFVIDSAMLRYYIYGIQIASLNEKNRSFCLWNIEQMTAEMEFDKDYKIDM